MKNKYSYVVKFSYRGEVLTRKLCASSAVQAGQNVHAEYEFSKEVKLISVI